MNPQSIHGTRDEKADLGDSQKRAKPTALRQAQIMPPHHVDLTLHPVTHEDVHVPAHISGADLSHEAPADANRGKAGQRRDPKSRSRSH
jgi:hypothetical protein